MIALALDTSCRAGSLALVRDGTVVECRVGDAARTHGERLPSELAALLARHGLAPGDIDVYGVAAGPGSFTGLRVGLATIQALALVTGRPVVAISSLVALAAAVPPERAHTVGAWIDAQRGEVFAALYARAERADPTDAADPEAPPPGLVVLSPSSVGSPEAMLDRWLPLVEPPALTLIGDGAVTYAAQIAARCRPAPAILPRPALAPIIGRLALERAARGGAVAPHAVRPVYVRRPDAELARARREGREPR